MNRLRIAPFVIDTAHCAVPRGTCGRRGMAHGVWRTVFFGLLACLACSSPVTAADSIALVDGLALIRTGTSGRSAIHTDSLEYLWVCDQLSPSVDLGIRLPNGQMLAWQPLSAGQDGWIRERALLGGHWYSEVTMADQAVMLLEAQGHSAVLINNQLRTGDPYSTGWYSVPVQLREGVNRLLFHVGRGQLRATLKPIEKPISLRLQDATLPDVIAGEAERLWAGLILVNATTSHQDALKVEVTAGSESEPVVTAAGPLLPVAFRKVAVAFPPAEPEPGATQVEYTVRLLDANDQPIDSVSVNLNVRQPHERQRRTFVSQIDGSVQYYAVMPPPADAANANGLYLTLHGASVEADGQAAAYAPKNHGYVVAPTNRRPFGFDWEDWGRWDAVEVLNATQQRFAIDPLRTYLTGHSMGGHGTWHLGATFPDRFAAIGPSAGWISFWSYAGATRVESPQPVEEILQRAATASDTLALATNYAMQGVYVLHGDQDDNVPVSQARQMREKLAEFHPNFVYKEQPGAGHWWGNACCDWPPMFEFFERHQLPSIDKVNQVDFVTASPGVSDQCHWVSIIAQEKHLAASRVQIQLDREQRRFQGTTTNVKRLRLEVMHVGAAADESFQVSLDDHTLTSVLPRQGFLWLEKQRDGWEVTAPPPATDKGPHRYGPFKSAFRNNMLFVYGTQGNDEENRWALEKARFDAETFWYRGNGAIEVVPDTAFAGSRFPDRSIILYGNADTNLAWPMLLENSPVTVRRGNLQVGGKTFEGDDLLCLFVRPRPDSAVASVAVVSGTGQQGMRATNRLRYFVSGVAYPDLTVAHADFLIHGVESVLVAGFFGTDWSLGGGELAWAEP